MDQSDTYPPLLKTVRASLSKPVSARRRRSQRGIEAIEFALFFGLMAPPFIWMFTNGMNFVRYNNANNVVRAAALMYVKGQNMNLLGTQEILAQVATGLNLQVDNGAAAPNEVQSNANGSGLIIVSEVEYVGSSVCTSCVNLNTYVFLQRTYIGNTGLQINGSTVQSALGNPATSLWSSSTGAVSSNFTNTGAQVATTFANLFPTSSFSSGQVVYVVEGFFAGGFGTGQFSGGGVYARVFM
jgi:hypothetical protein